MRVIEVKHPIVQHKLTILRDEATPRSLFRQIVEELGLLLAVEATQGLPLNPRAVTTPTAVGQGVELRHPLPVVVPILRAGLGMLPGVEHLLADSEVGFVGIKRDETTHQPTTYAKRLSENLTGRHCIILDPMIATGGSMNVVIRFLLERGASELSVLSIIASPEGIATVEQENRDQPVTVYLASLDEGLNADAYIVPGLGDAGDRLYGAVD